MKIEFEDLDEYSDYMILCIIVNQRLGYTFKLDDAERWYREYLRSKSRA